MKKRVISLLLALVMCSSLCTTAFATNSYKVINNHALTSNQYQVYLSDMEAFRQLSYDPKQLSIVDIDESDNFTYLYNISDTIQTYFKISYVSDDITLDVYEGTRHNTIEYLDNGIKIDGDFYPYQATTERANVTRARAVEYLYSAPPGYTTGSYYYSHYTQVNRFNIARKLASYTTAGLCALLVVTLFQEEGSTQAGAVLAALISTAIGELIQAAISNPTANNNSYLSYKIYFYEHEDSYALDRVYKCNAYFYPVTNCTGSASSSTYYYHNYFF